MPERVTATPAALELIERLRARHGDLIVHLSGAAATAAPPCATRRASSVPARPTCCSSRCGSTASTSPSRALIDESIADAFLERCLARVAAIKGGNPLDPTVMIGAQASIDQMEKILSYIDIGKAEGATVLAGGGRRPVEGLEGGYYVEPTVFLGDNSMRIFQEEIFGPVVAVTTFAHEAEALRIANDTPYGLGAGVWTRDGSRAYRMGRAIQAGRVWTNCYHTYPAHAAFGGYKGSGIGRENHLMMLEHYQQTKNLLVSYSPQKLGFF